MKSGWCFFVLFVVYSQTYAEKLVEEDDQKIVLAADGQTEQLSDQTSKEIQEVDAAGAIVEMSESSGEYEDATRLTDQDLPNGNVISYCRSLRMYLVANTTLYDCYNKQENKQEDTSECSAVVKYPCGARGKSSILSPTGFTCTDRFTKEGSFGSGKSTIWSHADLLGRIITSRSNLDHFVRALKEYAESTKKKSDESLVDSAERKLYARQKRKLAEEMMDNNCELTTVQKFELAVFGSES
jgi:hypothetical protein